MEIESNIGSNVTFDIDALISSEDLEHVDADFFSRLEALATTPIQTTEITEIVEFVNLIKKGDQTYKNKISITHDDSAIKIKIILKMRHKDAIKWLCSEKLILWYVLGRYPLPAEGDEDEYAIKRAIAVKDVLSSHDADAIKKLVNVIEWYVLGRYPFPAKEEKDKYATERAVAVRDVLTYEVSDVIKQLVTKGIIKWYILGRYPLPREGEKDKYTAERAAAVKEICFFRTRDGIKQLVTTGIIEWYVLGRYPLPTKREKDNDIKERAIAVNDVLFSKVSVAIKFLVTKDVIKWYVLGRYPLPAKREEDSYLKERAIAVKEILSSQNAEAIKSLVTQDVIEWYVLGRYPLPTEEEEDSYLKERAIVVKEILSSKNAEAIKSLVTQDDVIEWYVLGRYPLPTEEEEDSYLKERAIAVKEILSSQNAEAIKSLVTQGVIEWYVLGRYPLPTEEEEDSDIEERVMAVKDILSSHSQDSINLLVSKGIFTIYIDYALRAPENEQKTLLEALKYSKSSKLKKLYEENISKENIKLNFDFDKVEFEKLEEFKILLKKCEEHNKNKKQKERKSIRMLDASTCENVKLLYEDYITPMLGKDLGILRFRKNVDTDYYAMQIKPSLFKQFREKLFKYVEEKSEKNPRAEQPDLQQLEEITDANEEHLQTSRKRKGDNLTGSQSKRRKEEDKIQKILNAKKITKNLKNEIAQLSLEELENILKVSNELAKKVREAIEEAISHKQKEPKTPPPFPTPVSIQLFDNPITPESPFTASPLYTFFSQDTTLDLRDITLDFHTTLDLISEKISEQERDVIMSDLSDLFPDSHGQITVNPEKEEVQEDDQGENMQL